MTTFENEVRTSSEIGAVWEFVVPSVATTAAQWSTETAELVEQLFGAFGEFLTPIKLTYDIDIYPDDRPLESVGYDSDPEETVKRELADENGLTFADFRESTTVDRPGTRVIRRVPFEHNRLKVRLADGDTFVDQDDCVLNHKGEPREIRSKPDPLSVTVSHYPTREDDAVDSEYKYSIVVSLRSDIWVRRTEVGEANRRYLGEFLSDLADAVSPVAVNREKHDQSDFWYDLSLYSAERGNTPFDQPAIY